MFNANYYSWEVKVAQSFQTHLFIIDFPQQSLLSRAPSLDLSLYMNPLPKKIFQAFGMSRVMSKVSFLKRKNWEHSPVMTAVIWLVA